MGGLRSSFASSGIATLSPRNNPYSPRGISVPEQVRHRQPNRVIMKNYGSKVAEDANRFQGTSNVPHGRHTGLFNDKKDIRVHNALTGVGVTDQQPRSGRHRSQFSPRPNANGNVINGEGVVVKSRRLLGQGVSHPQKNDIRKYNTVIGTGVKEQKVFKAAKPVGKPISQRNVLVGKGITVEFKRPRGPGQSSAANQSVQERNLLIGTQESNSWWDKTVQPSPRQRNIFKAEDVKDSDLWSPRHRRFIAEDRGNPITGERMDRRGPFQPQYLARGNAAPPPRPFSICSGREKDPDNMDRWSKSPAVVPKLRLSELVA